MMIKLSLIAVGLVSLSGVTLAGPDSLGAALPSYWQVRATAGGLDVDKLGFNITEEMWYYDGVSTCVGWGEFDETCDYDTHVCAGYNGHSFGHGSQQIGEIKNMVDQGETTHELCPVCDPAPAGQVFVCHDGKKWSMPSGVVQNDFGLPGHMSLTGKGIWMTCDCKEVHRGYRLIEGTYWYGQAENADLDPSKVSWLNSVWYYDDKFSCVAKGGNVAPCDNNVLLCAGAGNTFGYGSQQMAELKAASMLPTGEHAYCPMP